MAKINPNTSPCRLIGSTGYDLTCTVCGEYTLDFERSPIVCKNQLATPEQCVLCGGARYVEHPRELGHEMECPACNNVAPATPKPAAGRIGELEAKVERLQEYNTRLKSYLSGGSIDAVDSELAWKRRALTVEAAVAPFLALLPYMEGDDDARVMFRQHPDGPQLTVGDFRRLAGEK